LLGELRVGWGEWWESAVIGNVVGSVAELRR
jgi:hypothetical protein